jgi:hypothetical protein
MIRIRRSATIAVLIAATGLTACGAVAEKAGEKATEKAIESQTGGDVDVDTDDGSVSIETEEGSASFGTGEVPEDWPDDIPLPDGLEVLTSSSTVSGNERLTAVTGSTDTEPEEILAWMKEELPDWEISGETTSTGTSGDLASAQFRSGERLVTLAATTGLGDGTNLTISHTAPE